MISFTTVFVILTSLISLIFALIVISIHSSFVSPSYPITNGDSDLFTGIDFFIHLQSILLFLGVMNIGLYAICLRLFETPREKITFSNAFDGIKPEIWLAFFTYVIGGILVVFILNDLFLLANPSTSIGLYSADTTNSPWWRWINNIVGFFKFFLPFLLVFYLIKFYLGKNGLALDRKKLKITFLSVVLLSFTILTLGNEVYSLIQSFFIYPITISFDDPIIPALIGSIIYVFVIAQFYLGLSGAFVFPFIYHQQKILIPIQDESNSNNSPTNLA